MPGSFMSQAPGGVPVTVPIQAGGDIVAVQTVTSGAQEGQPQMVMVPVSGTTGHQHQYVTQVAPYGATGYQPQQVEMLPAHGQGQYVTLKSEQVSLAFLVHKEIGDHQCRIPLILKPITQGTGIA